MLRGRTTSAQVSRVSALGKEKTLKKGVENSVRFYRSLVSSVVDLTSVFASFGKSLPSNWEQKAKKVTIPVKWPMRKLGMQSNSFHSEGATALLCDCRVKMTPISNQEMAQVHRLRLRFPTVEGAPGDRQGGTGQEPSTSRMGSKRTWDKKSHFKD